tara:strand:+ start:356 stop:925 length:570 start_codon:yes stop_codon:yes gene_type:complete
MRSHLIIPVKGISAGKSRLAAVLTDDERMSLVLRLAERTLEIAADIPDVEIILVTRDADALPLADGRGITALRQSGNGLNAALSEVAARLAGGRTLILPADLPALAAADIEAHLRSGGIGISPDSAGSGTNFLSLPEPASIPFCFGYASFAKHAEEAERAGLPLHVIDRPGISFDLDTPDDLIRLRGWP